MTEESLRRHLRKMIREVASTVEPIAGDSPPDKQVHLFDFDDTLGVTQNANAVMLYQDDKPAHGSKPDVLKWLQSMGVGQHDLLEPGIVKIPERDGYAAYLNSSGLARVQKNYDRSQQHVTGYAEPKTGESVLIDFTPSSSTDIDTTKPIKTTISKMKKMQAAGATTGVVTARKGTGTGTDIHGNTVTATNEKDMMNFLKDQGITPDAGVIGVTGQNKGVAIANKFLKGKRGGDVPEEIHFYDDLAKNTVEVEDALAKKIPSELHVYGPGEFDKGEADPNVPNDSFPAEKEEDGVAVKKEGFDTSRWSTLAGMNRR